MNIVLDTHALLWHITKDKHLSVTAKSLIRQSFRVIIPTIVLLELLYLLKKKGLEDNFLLILNKLKKNKKYSILSLDLIILEEVLKVSSGLEMHDRVIVASAELLKIPLITKDAIIRNLYQNTIW